MGSLQVILASGSPRRRELLEHLGVPFEVIPAVGVDESAVGGSPEAIVCALAVAKAKDVLALETKRDTEPNLRRVVLGADTLISLDGEPLGKPKDAADAGATLARLRGRAHEVLSGVAVVAGGVPSQVHCEITTVIFRDYTDAEIDKYVESGEPFGKAGSYAIQGHGRNLVASIEGCYYNVVGLPLAKTAAMLRAAGVPVATDECDCAAVSFRRGRGCGE